MDCLLCRRTLLAGLLVFSALVGCGSKPPPENLPTVHKVTGKVVDKRTGQTFKDGAVQFESLAAQGQTAIAEVQPDGTFALKTLVDGVKLEGAVPGAQRVTYMPRATADQSAALPVTLTQTFEVKEGDNDFTIEVDPQSP